MLSAPDAALVRLDVAVPALGVVLDPAALRELLRSAFTPAVIEEEPGEALIHYIRYKPGTSCLVGFRLHVGEEWVDGYAKAHRRGASEKLRKAGTRETRETRESASRPGRACVAVLEEMALEVALFPNDSKMRALMRLFDPRRRRKLMKRLLPDRRGLRDATLHTLRYKPNRRYVARLDGRDGAAAALLKVYTQGAYEAAKINSAALEPRGPLNLAPRIGHLDERGILAFQWLPGRSLDEVIRAQNFDQEAVYATGAALSALHAQDPSRLAPRKGTMGGRSAHELAAWLGAIHPPLGRQAASIARTLTARLDAAPLSYSPVHGDFYAAQALIEEGGSRVAIIDLDEAAPGEPLADLGLFIAHMECEALHGDLPFGRVGAARDALLAGYAAEAGRALPPDLLALYTASGLFSLAPQPFRNRLADWPQRIEAVLRRVEEKLNIERSGARSAQWPVAGGRWSAANLPRSSILDPAMPFLADALDPTEAQRQFFDPCHLSSRLLQGGRARVCSARLTRHKPGRRCLIEYGLEIEGPGGGTHPVTLIGKARAKGTDEKTFRLMQTLWEGGFGAESADGVSVPEPVGTVPPFQMWLQRKVPGATATELLAQPGGIALARRIADAICKLHNAGAPTHKHHTITDELRIVGERLREVARLEPERERRLERALEACHRLGESLPELPQGETRGIHRDFYPDQVLLHGSRLYLIDLDLYCEGDPALDIGNFLAHITEWSLRNLGDPQGLLDREEAMQERFLEQAGADRGKAYHAVQAYKTLTLARHVYISTRFPERRQFTERLLRLAEQRLRI